MDYGYSLELSPALGGGPLEELKTFLAGSGLTYAPGIAYTAIIRDGEGRIAATASLEGNVVKCVAAAPSARGEGLAAALLSELSRCALEAGYRRLFLYTKPENRAQFMGLGFHEVARAGEALLMENRRGGFDAWAEALAAPEAPGTAGAVVMNCNPMTLGHQYLVERAREQCDFLYVFVVSEDKSAVPAKDRLELVREALKDIPGLCVAATDAYLISLATFPDYFLKDKGRTGAVWAELDAAVFLRLAKKLGIRKRFVGSEPFCPVTAAYNQAMARAFPPRDVALVELPRLELDGAAVSATAVRGLLRAGRWEGIRPLVPPAVYAYFAKEENRRQVLARMDG